MARAPPSKARPTNDDKDKTDNSLWLAPGPPGTGPTGGPPMRGMPYPHATNPAGPVVHGPGSLQAADAQSASEYDRIVANPKFQQLVQERTRFGWILTAVILVVYFGFIGLIAFDKALLATKVGGGTASLGLFLGVGVILIAFALPGIYVARANPRFDALSADLKRSLGQ